MCLGPSLDHLFTRMDEACSLCARCCVPQLEVCQGLDWVPSGERLVDEIHYVHAPIWLHGGASIEETAFEHFCVRVRGANHDQRLSRCEPVEGHCRHFDNSDISLVELPGDVRALIEEPPRIRLDDLRHRLQSLLKILPHDPSSWVRAEDHSIPGAEQRGDNGFPVEGDGSVRHRRRIALPRRGVECDLPVRVSTLEVSPG